MGAQIPLLTEIIRLGTEMGFVVHDYANGWHDTDGKLHSIDLPFCQATSRQSAPFPKPLQVNCVEQKVSTSCICSNEY